MEIEERRALSDDEFSLKETFGTFTQLKVLDLTCVIDKLIIKISLKNLAKGSRLKTIILAYFIGDKYLQKLVIQNWSGYLERLDMPQKNLTKASVRQLNFMSDKLRTLSLVIPYGLTDQDLLHSIAPKTNKRVTDFKLFLCRPRGELFCELSQSLPKLTTFNFKSSGTELTDDKWTYYFIHVPAPLRSYRF